MGIPDVLPKVKRVKESELCQTCPASPPCTSLPNKQGILKGRKFLDGGWG